MNFKRNFPGNSKVGEIFFPHEEDCKFYQLSESVFVFALGRMGAELQGQTRTPYENGQFWSDFQKLKFFQTNLPFSSSIPNFDFIRQDLFPQSPLELSFPTCVCRSLTIAPIFMKNHNFFDCFPSLSASPENFSQNRCCASHFMKKFGKAVIFGDLKFKISLP